VLELARGIEGIAVDRDEPGAQDAEERDRVLEQVRHHQRHALALLQLGHVAQPAAEVARQAVEARVIDARVHAAESRERPELLAAPEEDLPHVGEGVDVGLGRHPGRIGFQPDLFHASPLVVAVRRILFGKPEV
jgi:hypothetical protein